jgi:hypothetical protein
MNRPQMIDALINDDLHDWNDRESMNEYLTFILREGFVGYANQTDDELAQELRERCLLDEVTA